MILTDQEVDARLSNPENLINKIKVIPPVVRKTEGSTAIPPMVRGLLASLSHVSEESDKEIGSVFGVSQPSVSNAARGLIGDRLDEDTAEVVSKAKGDIKSKENDAHSQALDNLVSALAKVGPKISEDMNAAQLTRTAKDMSVVVLNIKKTKLAAQDANTTNNTIVVLHSAGRRKEAQYEVLDV